MTMIRARGATTTAWSLAYKPCLQRKGCQCSSTSSSSLVALEPSPPAASPSSLDRLRTRPTRPYTRRQHRMKKMMTVRDKIQRLVRRNEVATLSLLSPRRVRNLMDRAQGRVSWLRDQLYRHWNPDYNRNNNNNTAESSSSSVWRARPPRPTLVMDGRWWFWQIAWALVPGLLITLYCETRGRYLVARYWRRLDEFEQEQKRRWGLEEDEEEQQPHDDDDDRRRQTQWAPPSASSWVRQGLASMGDQLTAIWQSQGQLLGASSAPPNDATEPPTRPESATTIAPPSSTTTTASSHPVSSPKAGNEESASSVPRAANSSTDPSPPPALSASSSWWHWSTRKQPAPDEEVQKANGHDAHDVTASSTALPGDQEPQAPSESIPDLLARIQRLEQAVAKQEDRERRRLERQKKDPRKVDHHSPHRIDDHWRESQRRRQQPIAEGHKESLRDSGQPNEPNPTQQNDKDNKVPWAWPTIQSIQQAILPAAGWKPTAGASSSSELSKDSNPSPLPRHE